MTLAMATIGLYSMVATLLWGRFAFGIDVTLEHPLLFVLAVVGHRARRSRMIGFLLGRVLGPLPRRPGRWATPSSCRSG